MECQNNFWPWFSKNEYETRYKKIRTEMEKKNLDCLILYGIGGYLGTDPGQPNVVYIASFASFVQTYVIFPLNEEPTIFITWGNHLKNAKQTTPIKDVRIGGMAQTPLNVAKRLKELGLENSSIGIVGAMGAANINLPYDHHIEITGELPKANFETVTNWFENLRLQKSEEEITYMKKAAAMTDAAYEVMVRSTRPGVRPCDLYNIVLRVSQDMDGKIPFGHVGRTPMTNPDMIYAHQLALTTPISMGDVIMTEIAVGWGGYFGKIWGTYFMGEPTQDYAEMFTLGQETYRNLHNSIKPELEGKDLANDCIRTIEDGGYNSRSCVFGWSNYNSRPDIRSSGGKISDLEFIFKQNQCLNVLSWPTDKEEKKGIWIGDTSLVTQKGIENLHKYPLSELHIIS